jgi:hypothetical protein
MRYKGVKKSLPEIARELNVDAIVEGSVIRSGQRVRVTAQLVQASTDHHLWAETYDRDLDDILKLQGEVADAIAQQVRAQLTPTQHSQLRLAHVVTRQRTMTIFGDAFTLLTNSPNLIRFGRRNTTSKMRSRKIQTLLWLTRDSPTLMSFWRMQEPYQGIWPTGRPRKR